MLVQALKLCHGGIRYPRAALRSAAPIVGTLIVEDWQEPNVENRALRVARLKHPTQSFSPELLIPLFDPVLVRCDHRGMVLTGFEYQAKDDETARVLQSWWLRPVNPPHAA